MNKVCVLGSMNMDLVVKVNNIPRVGETILSKSFEKIAGGKGANQAVAAKRCGAEVAMIAKIGKDENGQILKGKLEEDNINVKYVFEDKKIEIHFRYQDMVEKMKIIRDFCLNQVTDNMKEVV